MVQTNIQPMGGNPKPGGVVALEMNLDWVNKRGWVQGHVTTREAAQNLIDFANAIMGTLPPETREASPD